MKIAEQGAGPGVIEQGAGPDKSKLRFHIMMVVCLAINSNDWLPTQMYLAM